MLSELTIILNQEIELHKELFSLLHKDRELLIDLCVEDILENGKKKETCILKIKMLEESRVLLIEQLSQHYSLPVHELTMSHLIRLVEEPVRSSLSIAFSTLTALIKSIKEINQCNELIIKDSLSYMRRSLDFLSCAFYVSPTYMHSGRIKDPTQWGGLLSKEI